MADDQFQKSDAFMARIQQQSEPSMFPPPTPVSQMQPSPSRPMSTQELQDYQMQLMLLEQQNKKRLMLARQEQDIQPPQPQQAVQESTPNESTANQEPTPIHYTISENEIGVGQKNKLAAIKAKDDPVQQDTTSTIPPLPMPILGPSTGGGMRPPFANPTSSRTMPPQPQISPGPQHRPQTDRPSFNPASGSSPQQRQKTLLDMMQYIRRLEAQVALQKNMSSENGGLIGQGKDPLAINIQMFHCLEQGMSHLSEPEWDYSADPDQPVLKAKFPIVNYHAYINKKRDISFAVFNHYSAEHQRSAVKEAIKAQEPLPDPMPFRHTVSFISDEMMDAMQAFINLHPTFPIEFPEVTRQEANSPFIWWYHYRSAHKIHTLPQRQAQLMTEFTNWIERCYGSFFDNMSNQFRTGLVTAKSIPYLVRPGEVLVEKADDGTPMAYVATSRPSRLTERPKESKSSKDPNRQDKNVYDWLWGVRVRSYIYDGEFTKMERVVEIKVEAESEDKEVPLTNLNVLPLCLSEPEIGQRLEARGKMFWKCRKKQFVSHVKNIGNKKQVPGQRFMVDFATYKELHPNNPYSNRVHAQYVYKLWTNSSETKPDDRLPTDDSEPQAPEIYLFPARLPGFDLRRKKWVDLEVDYIQPVTWNEQAFHSLVADEDMKQLVLALVTNQLAAENGTDLIENKGNGLIMLLHGSPGTGKTFTAESVAEIAQKPLYPVTCGDIGTEPEAVEKYLASVFHLGKIWDCVVLLDEAEVFLEQRTLQDLKRNALVSVFLRALEYYEGILILTTNRVGTFDEAFKSRIQLALRYERLRDDQRKQIWKNFMDRLKQLGEEDNVDFADVATHLDQLASYPMNGREIRNSITTGRQLAKFMKEKMTVKHLKRAIGVAEKFDRYLAEVREGEVDEDAGLGGIPIRGKDGKLADDYFARTDRLR